MATASCPRCHQVVDYQAVTCPYCRTPLKAFGHPGIKLHRATGEEYLCQSCAYHADDSCTFPKRPYAKDCTLYQDIEKSLEVESRREAAIGATVRSWVRRNQPLLLLLGLLFICFLIALARS